MNSAIEIIKHFEGCKLERYICPAGVPTIGYGHTKNVPEKITMKEANKLLKQDMQHFYDVVDKYVTRDITDNQRDALCSFCYNVGQGNFTRSTLLRLLNKGDILGAANEFPKWRRAGGKILKGLVRRRKAERELFLKGSGYEPT